MKEETGAALGGRHRCDGESRFTLGQRAGLVGCEQARTRHSFDPIGGIQKIFIYNAVYLITRGMLWGNLLGIGVALFQKYTGFFSLDQATYYVSVIPMELKVWHILLLNAGTLVACVLMLLLPSFIISRITPVKAIMFR